MTQTQDGKNDVSSAISSRIAKRRRLALKALSEEVKDLAQANDSLKQVLNEIRPLLCDCHPIAPKIDAALKTVKRQFVSAQGQTSGFYTQRETSLT